MHERRPRTATGLVLILAMTAGLGVGLAGCKKAPIARDAPRSPYERYDQLRGTTVPKTVTDSFGREQPNLRGRLSTSE